MARKKRKTLKSRVSREENTSDVIESDSLRTTENSRPPIFTRKNLIIAAIILLLIVVWRFKGLLIAATVNGQPISRMELNSQLTKRFGSQVLDNIINERIILAATREQGIFVTPGELDARVASIEAKLSGQTKLSDALAVQGLTTEMFRRQLEIQLAIEKLFVTEATVSSNEVEDYISKNATYYKEATDPAALREEVKTTLSQQKINEKFEPWFSQIRNSAQVVKFVN